MVQAVTFPWLNGLAWLAQVWVLNLRLGHTPACRSKCGWLSSEVLFFWLSCWIRRCLQPVVVLTTSELLYNTWYGEVQDPDGISGDPSPPAPCLHGHWQNLFVTGWRCPNWGKREVLSYNLFVFTFPALVILCWWSMFTQHDRTHLCSSPQRHEALHRALYSLFMTLVG